MHTSTRARAGLAACAALAALGLAAARPAQAQTPAITITTGVAKYDFPGSLGFQFTTGSLPVAVTALGFYTPSTLVDAHQVGIFDDATKTFVVGTAGTTVTIAAGSTGNATNFAYAPDVLTLLPNTVYDILTTLPADSSTGNKIADPFLDQTTITVNAPGITYDTGLYSGDSGTNPGTTVSTNVNNGGGGRYIGPNFEVAAAPEPSQFAALGVGMLGLGGLALRARRRAA